MSVEMKTLTIGGKTYEIVDETAREKAKKFIGENPTGGEGNDTTDFWVESGPGYYWISELNQIVNQPAQYGFLINYSSDTDVFQIFRDQNEGETYFRSGDHINSWFQHWTKVYDSDNLTPEDLGAMDAKCVDKTSGDITDLMNNGNKRYLVNDTVTGMPVDGSYWFVEALCTNFNDATIIAYQLGTDSNTYIRSAVNGTWGEWHLMPITNADGELIIDGNIKGDFVIGEWLQTLADTHRSEPAKKFAVLDNSGWIYHRTPAEALSDMGGQAKITGTAGQFVVIGDDGNVTTKTIANAEEASF